MREIKTEVRHHTNGSLHYRYKYYVKYRNREARIITRNMLHGRLELYDTYGAVTCKGIHSHSRKTGLWIENTVIW